MMNNLFLDAEFKLDYPTDPFDPLIARVSTVLGDDRKPVLLISFIRSIWAKPIYTSVYYPFIYKGSPVIVK